MRNMTPFTFPSQTIHTFRNYSLYLVRQQVFVRNQMYLLKCAAHENPSRSRHSSSRSRCSSGRPRSSRSLVNTSQLSRPILSFSTTNPSLNLRGKYGDLDPNSSFLLAIARTFSSSLICRHHADEKSRKCWKCGGDTHPAHELFFCECGVVQKPADELTFFDLFQTEQAFDLDLKRLGKIYRDTQHRLHPDRFSTKSNEEQAFAEEQSALLNKAYFTLLKPLSRAIYMLKLVNITIEESESYGDPDFLMDIMTISEKISTASSVHEIDQLDEMNEERVDECIKQISKSFRIDDISDVKNYTIKLRYYTTIQERIKELRIKNLG